MLITHEALLLLYWLAMIPATIRSGTPEAFALQGLLLAVLAAGGYRIVRTGRKARDVQPFSDESDRPSRHSFCDDVVEKAPGNAVPESEKR